MVREVGVTMGRLLIISNRLPMTATHEAGKLRIEASAGGLATGLSGPHAAGDGLWIGWPGPTWSLDAAQREELDLALHARRLVPVHLGEDDVRRHYENFSNGLLWPLFHYLLDQVPLRVGDWDAYQRVNALFADHVASVYESGDRIWVHDYQLLLLPQMLRDRLPGARIGFFLHIPFPASAVLRALPHREELLRGVLGADLIGLHTQSYVRHFAAALLRILGLDTRVDRIEHGERSVCVRSFPMGVDATEWARLGNDATVQARTREIRGPDDCRILLGIDRLDYTKGIPRRLLAYEELLRARPELQGRVRLIQVAVPSRGGVGAYREFRQQIDARVGRINGAFATPTWTPIHYLHRGQDREEVAALYRAADVMLVTPIRDGMNLVAKEFLATRTDEEGVLVLSEFAGAAAELDGAIEVNPYDVQGTSRAIGHALDLDREERRRRMVRLRQRVFAADVHGWVSDFLTALDERPIVLPLVSPSSIEHRDAVVRRLAAALDHDGTLVGFTPRPQDAVPDAELVGLLGRLSRRTRTHVHIVSGRPREDLDRWFGGLSIGLHAEHGHWSRLGADNAWRRAMASELPSADAIGVILDDWAARTPGSFVERKSATLAWHWRNADPDRGRRQESELRLHLAELLSNVAVEVLVGDHVVEVRPHGVSKGHAVALATAACTPDTLVLAMGDDRTDDDLFAALGDNHVTVRVGNRSGDSTLRLVSPNEARAFLAALAEHD